MEATIVMHKGKSQKNKIMEDYVPKKLLKHNYRFFETDGWVNHQPKCSW